MGKLIVVFTYLLALVLISTVPTPAHETGREQATLEGVLQVHPKYLYKYYVKCMGTGQECALRKSDALKKIQPGSYVRVKGNLGTFYHQGGTKTNPSPFPAAWVMYMDVDEVTVLRPAKANSEETQVPRTTPMTSLSRLPVLSIDRHGDLGTKQVSDIVAPHDVSRVIVLRNETSAPDVMHIWTIDRILEANPKIQSFFYIDPNTGNRTRSHKSEIHGFFTALLLTREADCIGFDVSREKTRVFNSEGDGWVVRKRMNKER